MGGKEEWWKKGRKDATMNEGRKGKERQVKCWKERERRDK